MAQRRQKDILNRLADVGEEAFTRVAGSPATSRLLETVGGMRERLDEVQKKVRGIDALERRVEKLEKRLDDLDKPKSKSTGTSGRTTAAKKPAARKTTGETTRSTSRKKPASS